MRQTEIKELVIIIQSTAILRMEATRNLRSLLVQKVAVAILRITVCQIAVKRRNLTIIPSTIKCLKTIATKF